MSGNASIHTLDSKSMQVRADHLSILHWEDFSIDKGELFQFIQPSKHALVLNRVTQNHRSTIFGTLKGNGQVLLINPHGIFFGPNCIVNVGGLIASTLQLADASFLEKEIYLFQGDAKTMILNKGTIEATSKNVQFISRFIQNFGTIKAPLGRIDFLAGCEVLLKPEGTSSIFIRPSDDVKENRIGIHHLGTLQAFEVSMQADGNLYELAIKDEGTIDALEVTHHRGRVLLSAKKGTITVSHAIRAGEIEVTGQKIFIEGNAHLSVNHPHRPKQIVIGKNDTENLFIGEKVILEANALEQGKGGKILCVSGQTTLFFGTAKVCGGFFGGNGGDIEISGHERLVYQGKTERLSQDGRQGLLLLDFGGNFSISKACHDHDGSKYGSKESRDPIGTLLIDRLILEIEKGPLTIKTACLGKEEGNQGNISLDADIYQTYQSDFPLTLYSKGEKGIIWKGSLINQGKGEIKFLAPHGDVLFQGITGEAMLATRGNMSIGSSSCPIGGKILFEAAHQKKAEVKAKGQGNLSLFSKKGIFLCSTQKSLALITTQNGDLTLQTNGSIHLHSEEEGNTMIRTLGKGNLSLLALGKGSIQSLHLTAESGVSSIQTAVDGGDLNIAKVTEGIHLTALKGQATIEGGALVTLQKIKHGIHIFSEQSLAKIESIGPLSIETSGEIFLSSAQNDALVASKDFLEIHAESDLVINSDEGRAFFMSPKGLHLYVRKNIFLNGGDKGTAFIQAPNSHIFVGQNLELLSHAFLSGEGGPFQLSIGGDFIMKNAFLHPNPFVKASKLQINIEENLYMGGQTSIFADIDSLFISVGKSVYLDQRAKIYAEKGPLSLCSVQESLYFQGNSTVIASANSLTLAAGQSIFLENWSQAVAYGKEGINVNVDGLGAKGIGNGGLFLGPYAAIDSGDGPLKIYCAKRSLNTIQGKLNGFYHFKGPLFVNSNEEQWESFFPKEIVKESSFTFFYKESGWIQTDSYKVNHTNYVDIVTNYIGPFTAELFRDLHAYNEYTTEKISFQIIEKKRTEIDQKTFSLRKPYFPRQSFNSFIFFNHKAAKKL